MDEVEFGRYRLLSVIGAGAMGKVYKAHDTMMGRDVAIKVLPPELAKEPGYEERFRREAHTAARLTEPHIIPIHDTGEIDGHLYLVMPVIDGIDVHSLLRRDGPMSPQRAVQVIEQLAAALDAAHEAGLVHRDIKPSNALMTRRDFVYLIDFGIAHDAAATRLTNTGMIVGTMAYMAPERFLAGTADSRSDVYSLACVLHECLTGATPYPGDSVEQQIAGHLTLDPPRPSSLRSTVAAGFDEVIAAGMAKKPDERYQSARDLAAAAHRALTERPRPAREPRTAPAAWLGETRPAPAPARRDDRPPPPPQPERQPDRQQPAHLNFAAPPQRPPGWPAVSPPRPPDRPNPQFGTPSPPGEQRPRWQAKWPLIAGIVVILAAGAGITGYLLRAPSNTSQPATASQPSTTSQRVTTSHPVTTSPGVTPVAVADLEGLLLTPDQINAAMGTTGLPVAQTFNSYDDSTKVSDRACLPLMSPVQTAVYAGSGWSGARGQVFYPPGPDRTHFVQQAVVAFSSASDADAFFTASAQNWAACANKQFSRAVAGKPDEVWNVGPVSNTNGTLSATQTLKPGYWTWDTCQEALTAANNVIIEVRACSQNKSDAQSSAGVNIAHQIAAKVPTT